jgi:allantoicase
MVLLIMTPQQKLSNSTSYNDDGHWYAPFETKRRCRIAMNLSLSGWVASSRCTYTATPFITRKKFACDLPQ